MRWVTNARVSASISCHSRSPTIPTSEMATRSTSKPWHPLIGCTRKEVTFTNRHSARSRDLQGWMQVNQHMTTFAEWYREAQPGLLESVLRAVSRRAVAEDALDEAFEKAFARWELVQSMRSPNGWVYRVAVNAARRQLAREVREGERLAFATTSRAVPPPGGEAWLVVATLPIRQRTAVVLRHVGGMTEAEVADAMGVTRSTVSSTLASAYKTLGQQLAEPSESEQQMDLDL